MVMGRFFLFAYALILPSICQGIDADKTIVKEYSLVTISHEEGEIIHATFNFVLPDGTVERRILSDEHFDRRSTETTMTGPPGDYEITVGKPLLIKIVREGQPNPQPNPQPDPVPKPEPEPEPEPDNDKIKVAGVYFFEEQQERHLRPEQTMVITDIGLRDRLAGMGIRRVIFDKDLPSVEPWKSKFTTELPVVLFYQDSANYRIFPVPKTIAEMNALFDKVNQ